MMFSKTVLLTLNVLLLAATEGESRYTFARRKMLTLDHTRSTCSRNMACRLAICLWERIPTLSEDKCRYFDNNCSCPPETMCAMSNHFTPRNKLVTFQYRCKNLADFLRHNQLKRTTADENKITVYN